MIVIVIVFVFDDGLTPREVWGIYIKKWLHGNPYSHPNSSSTFALPFDFVFAARACETISLTKGPAVSLTSNTTETPYPIMKTHW